MAAWMLHGAGFGEEAGARNLAFFRVKVAAAGDERYLVCATGAAAVVSCANWFFLCVLQRVVVPVCVVLCVSSISGCRSHWNGCMCSVAMCVERCGSATWCCETHCNGCMKCCMGLALGRKAGARNLVFFRVKSSGCSRRWKVPRVCDGCGCGRFMRERIGSSSVFCNEWLFLCASFYAFLESLVADRIGMAAWCCMIVVMLCCDVRREMRVSYVMLRNAL